jgi:hypothetical protein
LEVKTHKAAMSTTCFLRAIPWGHRRLARYSKLLPPACAWRENFLLAGSTAAWAGAISHAGLAPIQPGGRVRRGKKWALPHGPEGRLRRSHTPGVLWGALENFLITLAHPRQRAAFTPTGLTPQKRALTSPQALCFNPARSRSTFARRQPPEACGSAGGGSRAAPCALFRALSRPPPRPPAASRWRPTAQTCVKPSLRSLQRVSCRYRQPRGADIDPSSRLSTSTGVRRAAARAGGGERDEEGSCEQSGALCARRRRSAVVGRCVARRRGIVHREG